jgi:hypothetical protein
MALADYYARSALSAAQALTAFDESAFAQQLDATIVGIAIGPDAADRAEGRAALDLAVRLLARLYPRLGIAAPEPLLLEARALALAINPAIELVDPNTAGAGIAIGDVPDAFAATVYAGSDGWDALIDDRTPRSVGDTDNPLGAGAAACLAATNLFRLLFTDDAAPDRDLHFSTFLAGAAATPDGMANDGWSLPGQAALVGAGAIGHAAGWALARAPLTATLAIVDHETLDIGNLQRYVLAARSHDGTAKAPLLAGAFDEATVTATPEPDTWAGYVAAHGHTADLLLLALDSAPDRRAAQSSLPRRVVNAWTGPGDLGVSLHSAFGGPGACVCCLYLPTGQVKNEDAIVAEGLGIPQLLVQVRTLLYSGAGVDDVLLDAVAHGLGVDRDRLAPFAGRPIRELYVDGICGGAVLPLGAPGQPGGDVHVPLAHQSALAGVLLAAAACRLATGDAPEVTQVTHLDPMRPVAGRGPDPVRAGNDGRCICEDPDFRAAYAARSAEWPPAA